MSKGEYFIVDAQQCAALFRLGRDVESAELPDELQGGVAYFLLGGGRLEIEERFDVSAHLSILKDLACGRVGPVADRIALLRFRAL